jgi:hypothetical protein
VGVTVEPDRSVSQDLSLALQDSVHATASLRGKVVASQDGPPISGATVALRETGEVRISGEDGSFDFSAVPAGSVTLHVSLMGYADSEGSLDVRGGQTVDLEVRLSTQPIEMDPIVVEAVRLDIAGTLVEVRKRAESGWGTVLMEEELGARRSASRTTDILLAYGASTTRALGGGKLALRLRRTGCGPLVYIDDVKVTRCPRGGGPAGPNACDPAEEAAEAVNMIHPLSVAAIEIYQGPGQTPGQYLDSNSRCGVILIWTKRGRGFDQ